jgi:hypothetical protein
MKINAITGPRREPKPQPGTNHTEPTKQQVQRVPTTIIDIIDEWKPAHTVSRNQNKVQIAPNRYNKYRGHQCH